jgi:hypothetical protein
MHVDVNAHPTLISRVDIIARLSGSDAEVLITVSKMTPVGKKSSPSKQSSISIWNRDDFGLHGH